MMAAMRRRALCGKMAVGTTGRIRTTYFARANIWLTEIIGGDIENEEGT
jgi:hypothetical protein